MIGYIILGIIVFMFMSMIGFMIFSIIDIKKTDKKLKELELQIKRLKNDE